MPEARYTIHANYVELIKMRQEIERLQAVQRGFTASTSNVVRRDTEAQLASLTAKFKKLSAEASRAGAEMERSFNGSVNNAVGAISSLQEKISSNPLGALGAAAGLGAVSDILQKVTATRAQFQMMESSINVLVGERKGAKLIAELNQLAKISPLDFKGTVSGAQMMLGFGIEAEKVPRYLSALSDVSMGNAQRFQSLNLAFSQMSAAGKLMGQDLLNFVA